MKGLSPYIFLLLLLSNCCKKKDKDDPCKNLSEVNAKFKIYEEIWDLEAWKNLYIPYESDTFYAKGRFIAGEDNAKYTWHIGSGNYSTKEVSLDFSSVPVNSIIPVTLIVEKAPNTACFKNDDGRDTFTKTIVIKESINIKGEFEAADPDDNSKKWNFSFKLDTSGGPNNGQYGFNNIPKGVFSTPVYNYSGSSSHREYVYSLSNSSNWADIRLFWQYGNQWDCYVYYGPWNANATRNFDLAKSYSFRATKTN